MAMQLLEQFAGCSVPDSGAFVFGSRKHVSAIQTERAQVQRAGMPSKHNGGNERLWESAWRRALSAELLGAARTASAASKMPKSLLVPIARRAWEASRMERLSWIVLFCSLVHSRVVRIRALPAMPGVLLRERQRSRRRGQGQPCAADAWSFGAAGHRPRSAHPAADRAGSPSGWQWLRGIAVGAETHPFHSWPSANPDNSVPGEIASSGCETTQWCGPNRNPKPEHPRSDRPRLRRSAAGRQSGALSHHSTSCATHFESAACGEASKTKNSNERSARSMEPHNSGVTARPVLSRKTRMLRSGTKVCQTAAGQTAEPGPVDRLRRGCRK